MPQVPALCDDCGAVFGSGIAVQNVRHLTLSGNRSKCPRCGSKARIPDGVFNAVGGTLELVAGPERTVEDLRRLQEVIREAQEQGVSRDTVANAIREQVPEFSDLVDLLPQTRSELYMFLTMLLTGLGIVVSQCEGGGGEPVEINVDVDQVVNKSVEQLPSEPADSLDQ